MTDPTERLTDLLADCYDDPDLFNTSILGQPPFWRRQREIAESVCRYLITVAYTGNAIGKDYLVGRLGPWWLYTRDRSQLIVTGPSQTVLGSVTWKEFRKACSGDPNDPLASIPLGAVLSEGIKASPLRLKVRGDWGGLGYSTTSVERASGQHNRKLFVIIEEASGVADEIFDAVDSLKYVRLLVIGNPLRARGRMVDLINQAAKDKRDGIPPERAVNAIQVPSTESPDAHLDESLRGLADKRWLADIERRYGRESLYYRSHVSAIVPEVDNETLLPAEWLDGCVAAPTPARDPRDVGLFRSRWISTDLGEGRERDESAIFVTDDLGVLDAAGGNTMGLDKAAHEVDQFRRRYQVPDDRISYDRVGVGRDFGNQLRQRGIMQAIPYAGSGDAREKSRFFNLRSEAAWRFRDRINPGFSPDPFRRTIQEPFHVPALPWWHLLREDLQTLTYDLVNEKQVRLVSKQDHCALLGRSPDRGDALLQRFAFI